MKGVSVQLVQDPNARVKRIRYINSQVMERKDSKKSTSWRVVGKKSKSISSQGDYNQFALRSEEKFLEILNFITKR